MIQLIHQAVAYPMANNALNHGYDGSVVLILGGVTMLAVALFLSLATQRRNPRPRGIRHANHLAPSDQRLRSHEIKGRDRGPRIAWSSTTVTTDRTTRNPGRDQRMKLWLPAVKRAAKKARLGTPLPLRTQDGRSGIQLTHCQTCLNGPQQTGCEREARILRDALRSVIPEGDVVELACEAGRPGSCRFEVFVDRD